MFDQQIRANQIFIYLVIPVTRPKQIFVPEI